jgi:glycyl-tRNA synthetase beta subunit
MGVCWCLDFTSTYREKIEIGGNIIFSCQKMAYVLASQIKEFVTTRFFTESTVKTDGDIIRAIVNRTHKQIFKIKKTDNAIEAIEAAFRANPNWSRTDDIRFNACCYWCHGEQ